MTATDELRRLLDERGVEWMPSVWSARDETFYKVGNTGFLATEMSGGRMRVCIEGYVTPEQAVEATLGRGTCRMEKRHMDWRCTGCGEIVGTDDPTSELFIDGNAVELWHYCPNCGRRIEVGA